MGINEIIMYIMMFFMLIAAVDRILSQFGGSARFLGKFGKSIEGSGGQFEEGFMAMGALGLAMVGMTALAPVLAHVLGPVIIPVYEMLGANPSMFAGTLLACDMGGFFLAKELAGGDVAAWLYSGLILGSMMGPTIVFSIPVALGIIEPSDRRYLALGVLAGIVTIPIGCIAGGLVAMYSGVQINGQPVEFTFALILMNMIPVIIVAILVALGLKFIPEKMINGFQIFAKFLVALITLGLAAAVVKFLLGWELIPGLDPIFMAPGDKPGEVKCISNDLEVPASAEIVLEGYIEQGETAPEGPYGDHTGYYNEVDSFPVFTVTHITQREDAIYHSTYTGRPPDEPAVLGVALNEVFVPILQKQFPEIVDFYLPPEGCSYRLAVVTIKKQYAGHAKRVMMGVWSFLRQFMYTKFVIVCDDDVNARDWNDVIWAITTRMDPARDTVLVENTPIDYLDFASPVSGLGSKMGLDATNKWPGETQREWGRPIKKDPDVVAHIDAIWDELAIFNNGKSA